MITIIFYLNIKEKIKIHSMYNMSSNPFKIGDIIKITACDIPLLYEIKKDNDLSKKLLSLRSIILVNEEKHIDIKTQKFTIKYHCDIYFGKNM